MQGIRGGREGTANIFKGVFLRGEEIVLKRGVMVHKLYEYTKNHWIVHFKKFLCYINFINKAIIKQNKI